METVETWSQALMPSRRPKGAAMGDAEWLALEEDAAGELVGGSLEEEEVPSAVHELCVSWLIWTLRSWLADRGGFVLGSELKLLLEPGLGRKPDLVVVLPGSPPPPRMGPLRTPPDMVFEIVSPTLRDERRDRVEKMGEYATFGVPRYVLVDPALGSIEVFVLDAEGRYARSAAATQGRLEVPGCAGLGFDLDALWAELQRLGAEG
jgi:Uma2 family endonuclease